MESKSKSLNEILAALAQIDDELPPDDFDPATVIGNVKDKVDAIKWRIDKWESDAKMIREQWIKPLNDRVASLLRKSEKLSEYVKQQMIMHNFEKLPGNMFTAALRKNPPSLKLAAEPTADLFLDFPEYVKQLPVEYEFDKERLREDLKAGKEISFAHLDQSTRVSFTAKKEQ